MSMTEAELSRRGAILWEAIKAHDPKGVERAAWNASDRDLGDIASHALAVAADELRRKPRLEWWHLPTFGVLGMMLYEAGLWIARLMGYPT